MDAAQRVAYAREVAAIDHVDEAEATRRLEKVLLQAA